MRVRLDLKTVYENELRDQRKSEAGFRRVKLVKRKMATGATEKEGFAKGMRVPVAGS